MAKSPTARSLEYLRDNGWPLVQVVEHYNPFSKKRNDLFGFADVLAAGPEGGILFIQVTSATNVNARLNKMANECSDQVETILNTENTSVEIHGWRKVRICTQCGKMKFKKECSCKGSKHVGRWRPRIIKITKEVLNDAKEKQKE